MERTRSPCVCYLLRIRSMKWKQSALRIGRLHGNASDAAATDQRRWLNGAYANLCAIRLPLSVSISRRNGYRLLRPVPVQNFVSSIQFHSIPRINFTKCNTETCAAEHQQQDFNSFPHFQHLFLDWKYYYYHWAKAFAARLRRIVRRIYSLYVRQVVDLRRKKKQTDCELAVWRKERIYF